MKRYGYIKTFTFKDNTVLTLTAGSWTTGDYNLVFQGITKLPFYLVSFQYYAFVYDGGASVSKVFNLEADARVEASATWVMNDLNKVLGDNVAMTVSPDLEERSRIYFRPGTLYDYTNFPVMVSDNAVNLAYSCFVDSTYTPAGTLSLINSFTFSIGVDSPIKMATGDIIPENYEQIPYGDMSPGDDFEQRRVVKPKPSRRR